MFNNFISYSVGSQIANCFKFQIFGTFHEFNLRLLSSTFNKSMLVCNKNNNKSNNINNKNNVTELQHQRATTSTTKTLSVSKCWEHYTNDIQPKSVTTSSYHLQIFSNVHRLGCINGGFDGDTWIAVQRSYLRKLHSWKFWITQTHVLCLFHLWIFSCYLLLSPVTAWFAQPAHYNDLLYVDIRFWVLDLRWCSCWARYHNVQRAAILFCMLCMRCCAW